MNNKSWRFPHPSLNERTTRHDISNETEGWNDMIDPCDLIAMYRTPFIMGAECTLFSSNMELSSGQAITLGHQTINRIMYIYTEYRSAKKEQTTDTHKNMNEPQKPYAK